MAKNGDKKVGSGGFKSSRGPGFRGLEQVFDDVWWAYGTTRFAPGVIFPRNMTVVRQDGALIVIHPVLLPDEEQRKLEELGEVKHIVRLGAFHGMDDRLYVERYQPTVWAPPGVDQPEGVKTDRELVPGGDLPLGDAVLLSFERSKAPETALVWARHGGVLLTCDSVQNWETTDGCSFLGGAIARVMGFRGRACLGPGWRKECEPKEGEDFGPAFKKLLEHDFAHLLSGHGAPLKETAKTDLAAQVQKAYG